MNWSIRIGLITTTVILAWRVHKSLHSDNGYETSFWLLLGWIYIVLVKLVISSLI